ncbi:hypothetical protein [Actinocrispum sp. NPDC049592]|uniref:hypothetical protein n=1 Tax=Actinocrispum sp. NPDC049592 TaxID=3154835 RepID=UPI00344AB97B
MPDGAPQQQPLDPAAQRAQEQMRQWKQQHQDPNSGGGWFGNVISTVDGLVAAAEAGQLAVNPDTAQAILKQLSEVQNRIADMQLVGTFAGTSNLQLGGGYATDIAAFNTQVTKDEIATNLKKFAQELEQLKTAVSKSLGRYTATDGANSQQINSAGDGL